jgi:uncharacterized protein YxeA
MTSKQQALTLFVAVVAALAMSASAVLAANPKDGTYVGSVESGKEKITLKVDGEKVTTKYCGYSMKGKEKNGKFKFAYNGPGGTYVGGNGEFTSKRKAEGKITTDFLCDTEGETFTATLK